MAYELEWQKPIDLQHGKSATVIYTCDLAQIPNGPGVYFYTRMNKSKVIPIYIGKALNLRVRIKTEFKSLPLMGGIKDFPQVKRQLRFATLVRKSGVEPDRAIRTAENAMIDTAVAMGFELVNKHGTKRKRYEITSHGHNKKPFPKMIFTAHRPEKAVKKKRPTTK